MAISKTLTSMALSGIIGLSGCVHNNPKQEAGESVKPYHLDMPTAEWVRTTDSYINLHELLSRGNYEKAQEVLEESLLKEQIRIGHEFQEIISGLYLYKPLSVIESNSGIIKKRVGKQLEKIREYNNSEIIKRRVERQIKKSKKK